LCLGHQLLQRGVPFLIDFDGLFYYSSQIRSGARQELDREPR
jgi:hypothetical protein